MNDLNCIEISKLKPYSIKSKAMWFWRIYYIMYDETKLFSVSDYDVAKAEIARLNGAYREGYIRCLLNQKK